MSARLNTRTLAAFGLSSALLAGGGAAALAGSGPASAADASAAAAPTVVHTVLDPSSPALKACFPKAHAHVDVALTTDAKGKDTFRVRVEKLKPHTAFTVFLLQQAGAPFGAAEYLGDVFTDGAGNGTNTFTAIVEEAFAFNNATGSRTDLNAVGMWFADPTDDDSCLGPASPVTGFDGDASAGVQMLNSGTHLLP
jgi:hypothetical protein